jgi:hypothetical protein
MVTNLYYQNGYGGVSATALFILMRFQALAERGAACNCPGCRNMRLEDYASNLLHSFAGHFPTSRFPGLCPFMYRSRSR